MCIQNALESLLQQHLPQMLFIKRCKPLCRCGKVLANLAVNAQSLSCLEDNSCACSRRQQLPWTAEHLWPTVGRKSTEI